MPTFNTAIYDAQKETRANVSRLADANIASGEVEFAIIPYTLAGGEVGNDVINLCVLPAGTIPVPGLSKIVRSAAVGTTLTFDVGTAADLDGWIDGATISGAVNEVAATSTSPAPAWIVQTPITADAGSGNAVVKATFAGASALAAGAVVYFVLAYKRGR